MLKEPALDETVFNIVRTVLEVPENSQREKMLYQGIITYQKLKGTHPHPRTVPGGELSVMKMVSGNADLYPIVIINERVARWSVQELQFKDIRNANTEDYEIYPLVV